MPELLHPERALYVKYAILHSSPSDPARRWHHSLCGRTDLDRAAGESKYAGMRNLSNMEWRWLSLVALAITGCQSPYYADRGALAGGVGGAGVGALVGSATHHPLAGALIGGGVGAASGALVGGAIDQVEAKNRAQIAAQVGRPMPAGGVPVDDVIAMTRSGVDEELVMNHIRANGMARPIQASELIVLQQQGVSKNIISTMQASPPRVAAAPMVAAPVPAMYYYPPPAPVSYWGVGF